MLASDEDVYLSNYKWSLVYVSSEHWTLTFGLFKAKSVLEGTHVCGQW